MTRLLAILALTTAAHAGDMPPCGPHDAQAAELAKRYVATVQIQGLNFDGRLMELFANPAKGNWSAVMTTPDGRSCLVAGGAGFRIAPPGQPA